MKAKTILDAEKKDAIDIATELCYSEEVKRKIAQAKSVYEIGRILKQARLDQRRKRNMNLEEFRKTLSSDATEENAQLTDVEATRNIEFHDMSKNTLDEYTPYDNYFYGEQTPAIIEAFNLAWLMHIHRNPHHWQYWVLINDEPKEGTILIEMPYPYIIEMICDWWAFSWIKGDLSEMFAWYKDHADYIKLHNNTRSIVEEILEIIRTKLTEVENAEN